MRYSRRERQPSATGRRSGFSLLEVIVAVTILAILAGAAVPIAGKVLDQRARKATLTELDLLADAAGEHFRDTGVLPTTLEALEQDPGTPGWSGPYVRLAGVDALSGLSRNAVDAWSGTYAVALGADGSTWTLTAPARGGQLGDGNDLGVTLDVTPIRRAKTLAQLVILNQAVTQYNAKWMQSDPLPLGYPALLGKLVSRGYLPSEVGLEIDGWGDEFFADPPGSMPVVKVSSPNLSSLTPGGGGGAGGGGGQGGGQGGGNKGGNGKGDDKGKKTGWGL
jgi:prepilin-type N-terminal cleavage/methylation domain-containing protein